MSYVPQQGTDLSSDKLCRTILDQLFLKFHEYYRDKLQQARKVNNQIDLDDLFSTVKNPLFQDFLTYFSILSQHTLQSVLTRLHNWRNEEYVFNALFLHIIILIYLLYIIDEPSLNS